jgi:hypothetical protein
MKYKVKHPDMDDSEMTQERLMEYAQNIADANESEEVPHKKVMNINQAIANAEWAGDIVK